MISDDSHQWKNANNLTVLKFELLLISRNDFYIILEKTNEAKTIKLAILQESTKETSNAKNKST